MKNTLQRINEIVEEGRSEQGMLDMLEQILHMSPEILLLLMALVKSVHENSHGLERVHERQTKALKHPEEESTELSQCFGALCALITQIAQEHVPERQLRRFINEQGTIIRMASQLPNPFSDSPAVWGAMGLTFLASRGRPYDYYSHAYRWKERLGEPATSTGDLLRDCPGLMPVAFNSKVVPSCPQLFHQYFGGLPALQSYRRQRRVQALLRNACEKWPLEDIFAFCPLPTWSADDSHKGLWLEAHTWQEQQAAIRRLGRLYPQFTVRAATLSELVFLDWSMRIATHESPMGIWDFRCEHPSSTKRLLRYGSVGDKGGEIGVEDITDDNGRYGCRVMPLFILPTKTNER